MTVWFKGFASTSAVCVVCDKCGDHSPNVLFGDGTGREDALFRAEGAGWLRTTVYSDRNIHLDYCPVCRLTKVQS